MNVGCVPSKTLIRAAEVLHRAGHHPFAGIPTRADRPDFRAVVSYDIAQRTLIGIEPIPRDRTDAEQIDRFNAAFLANSNYRRVSWHEFRALVGGIGSVMAMA